MDTPAFASDALVSAERPAVPGYTLLEALGGGGMGIVYRALQTALERTVAVKLLRPHLRGDADTVRRFCDEARTASRLNHPNSVAIIDFGVTAEKVPFLVMEHLPGVDLGTLLARGGPLGPERVCRIAVAVLGALEDAHSLGIVHRDLKPENVIAAPRRDGTETVKVVDFGLAQIAIDGDRRTEPGLVLGTPLYMAPEQFEGDPVDGRADLYSLGVMMFELCTGKPPFDGRSPMEIARHHFMTQAPDPRDVAPGRGIDAALAALIGRALAKDPADRFQTAAEMAAGVEGVLRPRRAPRVSDPRCRACQARLDDAGSCPICTPRPMVAPEPPAVRRALLQLEELRAASREGGIVTSVRGAPGSGKSSMLARFAARAAARGDFVAFAHAHPIRAAVAYYPVRAALTALVQACGEGVDASGARAPLDDLADRSGLAELVLPGGIAAVEGASRDESVAAAVAAAVRLAAGAAGDGGVVLLFDDSDEYDELSLRVLEKLVPLLADSRVLVVIASSASSPLERRIRVDARLELDPVPGDLTPLHRRLLATASWLPLHDRPAVADLVGMATLRLEPRARALVQAVAVLGDCAPAEAAQALVGWIDPVVAETLSRLGLLEGAAASELRMHPLVRGLVEATTPAEVRRGLHDRALVWHEEKGSPLEVRVEHAVRGGDPELALLLLDQIGQITRKRGDLGMTTTCYRTALDLARRELSQHGDEHFGRAFVTFSRALAEALRAGGRDSEAEGVLSEALAEALPGSRERVEMLVTLGRVALGRRQLEKALAAAREALGASVARGDPALAAQAERLLRDARERLGLAAHEPELGSRPAPSGAPSVLVVEDDPHCQATLRGILEDEGYEVHCASNGQHALRVLGRIPRPSGILVDLMMPVMNGWDLLEALRENSAYASIPVAVVSAIARRAPENAPRITKPVRLDALLETVAQFRAPRP